MKESMSATWDFQIIIIFILIFVAYLTVSVSYYKVFKAKNDIVSIIERQEGLTTGSTKAVGIINNYLVGNAYNAKGSCQVGQYAVDNLSKDAVLRTVNSTSEKYYYCVSKAVNLYEGGEIKSYTYRVKLFFSLNLPVIGDIIDFSADGTTMELRVVADNLPVTE